jgi:acyl carrier protein
MSIDNKVQGIIAKQLGVDVGKVVPEAKFVEDLGVDSLDTVELILAFEEVFKIEIVDEDAEKMLKVKDAVKYIEDRI